MKSQRLEDSSYVDLGAAGRANVEFMQAKVDKFLNELEDLVTRGWESGRVWTFIERIQDNENWVLCQQLQHVFEIFLQRVVTRLLSAIFVCLVKVVENVTATTRAIRKLKYERAQEVVTALLD